MVRGRGEATLSFKHPPHTSSHLHGAGVKPRQTHITAQGERPQQSSAPPQLPLPTLPHTCTVAVLSQGRPLSLPRVSPSSAPSSFPAPTLPHTCTLAALSQGRPLSLPRVSPSNAPSPSPAPHTSSHLNCGGIEPGQALIIAQGQPLQCRCTGPRRGIIRHVALHYLREGVGGGGGEENGFVGVAPSLPRHHLPCSCIPPGRSEMEGLLGGHALIQVLGSEAPPMRRRSPHAASFMSPPSLPNHAISHYSHSHICSLL